jgi:predicted alpha/beta-hydrolase family hydrolase
MRPIVLLSHGLDSGPDATKVSALAAAAAAAGFSCERLDYRDLDAQRAFDARIERLVQRARGEAAVIMAGSSLGAFTSGLASLVAPCVGLFLLALPIAIPGYPRRFAAREVPTELVHGWDDALCPVDAAIDFARARRARLTLLPDDHRLSGHVAWIAARFHEFLRPFA